MKRAPIALLFSFVATAAVAGEGNSAALLQLSPAGTTNGNTLSIDQSEANYSVLRGVGTELAGGLGATVLNVVAGTNPLLATQRGEGNAATIKMTGEGGELQLLQTNFSTATWLPDQAGGGNVASVTLTGDALAGVIQIGDSNLATLSLEDGARGLVAQWGTNLSATLEVASRGSGTVVQIGNNSSVGTVSVLSNNQVTYTQIGNNLQSTVEASVYSTNQGSITITQTAFGQSIN